MRLKRKSKEFRLEIRLGLVLIVLLLAILDIAAYYTLYRVGETVEAQIREELTEAAVVLANSMTRLEHDVVPPGLIRHMKEKYSLSSLDVLKLDYDRIISIKNELALDSVFYNLDSTIISSELSDILNDKPVYRHKNGSDIYQLLFPAEFLGSTYMIALARPSSILGPIESAMRILVFFGFLTAIVIIFVSVRLIHTVLTPFDKLKETAEASGHYDKTNDDEVEQLISTYEEIINDLKTKELELVKLNRIITQKAADLEVYNDYILKSVSAGIITLDCNRIISTLNRAAGVMLGIDVLSVDGNNADYLLNDFPLLKRLIQNYFENGEAVSNQEITITVESRDDMVLAVSVSPLLDSSGDNIGCVIILNDQTKFIRLQEELALNRRMASLGEMSAGLAHQLRNSTTAIVGFARLIEKKSENPLIRENIDMLTNEASQAETLIARFLDYSRPLKVAVEPIDLAGLFDEIIASLGQKFPNISIKSNLSHGNTVTLPGDPLLLKQALANIVDNACNSYLTTGIVVINYVSTGKSHTIEVIDNGSGIADKDRDNIFTPFFSGSPSGSGLGLPLALKIAAMHGGSIGFRNNPDGGTIFSFTLPVSGFESGQNSHTLAAALKK